ncbi:MAG: hypothetical protein JSS20_10175 [Proteobacteria bacterium]|nr:hypothetical protein [Pseudomonadota bacterium]
MACRPLTHDDATNGDDTFLTGLVAGLRILLTPTAQERSARDRRMAAPESPFWIVPEIPFGDRD